MVHRSTTLLAASAAFLLAACGSSVSNAPPRLTPIPLQAVAGGTALSLDLSAYASDREGSPLAYSVVAGGGSFTASTYDHTFETIGTYTVSFQVSDVEGHVTTGAFQVKVTSARLAVVRVDTDGMQLLDTDTNAFVNVLASGQTPSVATTLAKGQVVYHLNVGGDNQLWVFDTSTRVNTRLGATATGSVTWRAKTSDDRLLFTTGTMSDTDLHIHNPATGLTLEVSGADGEVDGNPMVNAADLVFYETGSGGQADVYYYDPSTNASVAVITTSRDEHVVAVLPNGGAVLSRVGDGGETDLHYFRVGTGLVEIGADQPTLGALNKTFHAGDTGSRVVLSVVNGADTDLWFWNPATGQTTAIATGAVYGFQAVEGTLAVYHQDVSGSDRDVYFRDLASTTTATVRNAADITTVMAVTTSSGTSWALVQGSGATSTVTAVSLVAAPVSVVHAVGGTLVFGGALPNGDVVVQRADGTALGRFDASGGTWSTIAGTAVAFAGAGADAGDFVYSLEVSAQTDLSLWDDSATASVVVSSLTGADEFQAATSDGKVLFTHVYTGNTNKDLVVWEGPTTTRLTNTDPIGLLHDHTVLGVFAGSQ